MFCEEDSLPEKITRILIFLSFLITSLSLSLGQITLCPLDFHKKKKKEHNENLKKKKWGEGGADTEITNTLH